MNIFAIDVVARTMGEDRLREAEQRRLVRLATQRNDYQERASMTQTQFQPTDTGSTRPRHPRGIALWRTLLGRSPRPTLVDTARQ